MLVITTYGYKWWLKMANKAYRIGAHRKERWT